MSKIKKISASSSTKLIPVVSWLEKLLEPVLKKRFKSGKIEIQRELTKSSASTALLEKADNALGDQIQLSLPYAKRSTQCLLTFCWIDPLIPPEFNMINDACDADFYENMLDFVWNPYDDALCLLNFIEKLMTNYRDYHLNVCRQRFNRVWDDMDALDRGGFYFDAYVGETGAAKGGVVYVIYLHIPDLERTIELSEGDNVFTVMILVQNYAKPKVLLYYSPFLTSLFDNEQIELPPVSDKIEATVGLMQTLVAAKIQCAIEAIEVNRTLIKNIRDNYPMCQLLDYTPVIYKKASFLMGSEDFRFILKVDFPMDYPRKAIKISLNSVTDEAVHRNEKQPFSTTASFNVQHTNREIDKIFSDLEKLIQKGAVTLKEMIERSKITKEKIFGNSKFYPAGLWRH